MSRVWRKFLWKVSKAAAIIIYICAVIVVPGAIAHIITGDAGIGFLLGLAMGIVFPVIGYLLYDVFQDCKQEVDDENKRMMRSLGGKY